MDFFAVKVHGSDVNPGICLYKSLFSDSWVDVNSINFNSKKVYEDEIFSQQDIYIYILQFSSGESKEYYTNIQNPNRPLGTLKFLEFSMILSLACWLN